MIQVKCVGGECNGVTVKVDPQPTYYEVIDPRDPARRDYYILEVGAVGRAARAGSHRRVARPCLADRGSRLRDVFELLDRPLQHFSFEPAVVLADRADSLEAL